MPRNLDDEKHAPDIPLTGSPEHLFIGSSPHESASAEFQRDFVTIPEDQQYRGPPNLHPYTRPLTISDLESATALENAAFADPVERASRDKITYRLSKCGELCMGIFCTAVPGSDMKAETLATGRPVETGRKNGAVSVLLGHVVSAKTTTPFATDASMDYPRDWAAAAPAPSDLGHQERGRTIVLHSVAVLPRFQRQGLGRILMTSFMQQMSGAGIADRLVLIAHDHKVAWYEKLGFVNKGKSDCQFGGGGWYDMVFELKALEPKTAYG